MTILVTQPDFAQLRFEQFRENDLLLTSIGRIGIAPVRHGVALRIDCGEGAANPGGKIHGGALSALFDVAFYEAARSGLSVEAVTISLEVKFLQAGDPAVPLFVVAQVLRAGRTLATCSGAAFQRDRIIAHASGQFIKA